jgi:hypothetical protein
MKSCTVPDCGSKHYANNYCNRHYLQMWKYGKILERTRHDKNEIKIKEKYALLYLYDEDGKLQAKARIDLEDIKRVSNFRWSLNNKGYAYNRNAKLLHSFIMNYEEAQYDHENRNGLDCRKHNLRPSTQKENTRNRSIPSNNTSGAKGVSWKKQANKFCSRITVNAKVIHLGYFDDLIKAAKAYNKAAKKYFGEFAHTNDLKELLV